MTFLLCCLAATFPVCWLTPGAKVRYFLPLFPMLCALIGIALERALEVVNESALRRRWGALSRCLAFGVAVLAVAVLASAILEKPAGQSFANAPLFTIAWFLILASAAVLLAWLGRSHSQRRFAGAAFVVAAVTGGVHTALWLNTLIVRSIDTAGEAAAVKHAIPQPKSLISFGPIHHRFAFYYRDPIRLAAWPQCQEDAQEVEYFCFSQTAGERPTLPFDWTPIAAISCDRNVKNEPQDTVIVGRRISRELADKGRDREQR
jgi:hypothetical protein